MKRQSKKPFDASTIPDDLCPIATKQVVIQTGEWRAMRPIVNTERCVKCGTCWVYCPTQCVVPHATHFAAGLTICKGCGVCAAECPHRAITMVEELED